MKNTIVALLMGLVSAVGVGWFKDKLAFPQTAVEQLKSMAQEADTSSLGMKVLGGDIEKSTNTGLSLCLAENKSASDNCVVKGVETLKSALAKREQISKATETVQQAATKLTETIEAAPFSSSVKPLIQPLMDRIKNAAQTVTQSRDDVDFHLASLAEKLASLNAGEGAHKQVLDQLAALKSGGLQNAFARLQALRAASGK